VLSVATDRDVLWLTPRQSPYAIAWGFIDGEFEGWYINLQTPPGAGGAASTCTTTRWT
jgi:hypothetical protein